MKSIIPLITPLLFLGSISHAKDPTTLTDNPFVNDQAKTEHVPVFVSKPSKLQIHTVEDLKFFHVGEIQFQNMDFKTSIELLKSSYGLVCQETYETPLPIEFKVDQFTSEHKFTVTLEGSFEKVLEQLCAFHNMKFELKDNNFICSPYISDNPNKQVVETTLLPSYVFNKTKTLSLKDLTSLANTDAVAVKWIEEASTLIMSGKQSAVSRIKRIVNNHYQSVPIQSKISTKIISFNKVSIDQTPIFNKAIEKGALSEGEVELLMKKFAQEKGTDVVTLASIISRINEEATYENYREILNKEIMHKASLRKETHIVRPIPYIGHKIKNKTRKYIGLSIDIHSELNYHSIEGMSFSKLIHSKKIENAQSKEIKKYHAHLKMLGRDGFTHVFKLDIPGSDQEHLILITPSIIDATGYPLKK